MFKRYLFVACLMILLVFQTSVTVQRNLVFAQQRNPRQSIAQEIREINREKAQRTFKKGRKLLVNYGLPFEPNELLEEKSQSYVLRKLHQMPEFQSVERVSKRIKGVRITDTLYMPEQTTLDGDTVIIARHLIFEGKDVLIKGNYDLHVFPLETLGALGTSLTEALSKQPHFIKSKYKNLSRMSFSSLNLPLIENNLITVDLHGYGRKDWLEQQKNKKKSEDSISQSKFRTASYLADAMSVSTQEIHNNHGNHGSEGTYPGIAGTGTNGSNGAPGTTGACNGNKDGGQGGIGVGGGNGIEGTIGGLGGDGTPGGNLSWYVPYGNNTSHHFNTYGGTGGQGGIGGTGGTGGTGGNAGPGGSGASCSCNIGQGQGGPGNNGGDGGFGGKGGKGGKGGNGKNGGDVTVSVPDNYYGSITQDTSAGLAGLPGPAGSPGSPGAGGDGSDGGSGGSNISCGVGGGSTGASGTDGRSEGNLGFGEAGDPGSPGTKAGDVTITPREPIGGGGSGCSDTCMRNGGQCINNECIGGTYTPIVIDVAGNGFDLTNNANGVFFDIDVDDIKERVSWTSINSDDAWLTLDRNENGKIDNSMELFGNFTPQSNPPLGTERNGFLALARYDKPQYDGNNDGVISADDDIFTSLRLWQDTNHNGISEQNELKTLSQSGLTNIELDYKESNRTDEHGNQFKYRAKVKDMHGSRVARWAWDVFIVSADQMALTKSPLEKILNLPSSLEFDDLLGFKNPDANCK
jgi:hypothetical protein